MKTIKDIIKQHSKECNPFVYELSLDVPDNKLILRWAYVWWKFKLVSWWDKWYFDYEYMTHNIISSVDEFVDEVMDRLKLHPTAEECIWLYFIW